MAMLEEPKNTYPMTADRLLNQPPPLCRWRFLLLRSILPARLVFHLSFVHVVEQRVEGEVAAKSVFLRCSQRSFGDAAVGPGGTGQAQQTHK